MMKIEKIGFGGGCHWCTEAVFSILKGVTQVEQGWIASVSPHQTFSEAVIVHFDGNLISLETLVRVHLHTHSSTSYHAMRNKYRSAVYYFETLHLKNISECMEELKSEFIAPLITQTLPFSAFKASEEKFQKYYEKNPEKPFCTLYIDPKLELVKKLTTN
ncbi:peptide-methionine (S)-S-oxide reductase [Ascidiimonas sp. W6]|uniref:peptide-methionine (S)-S-oxide reductase n=1 Tax=Ascidiimonas meishanensis TaxID=3128903 RepID=UPI0030EBDCF6